MKNIGKNWLKTALTAFFGISTFFIISTSAFAADGDVSTVKLNDTNNNGKIDQILLVVAYANAGGGAAACTGVTGATTGFVVTDTTSAGAVTVASTAVNQTQAGVSCTVEVNLTEGANSSYNTSATADNVVYTPGNLAVTDGANPASIAAILTGVVEVDQANPVLLSVAAGTSSGANTLTFTYSEPVYLGGCTSSNTVSSATCGDLTTAGTFVGLGNFATDGTIVVPTTKNLLSGHGTAAIVVTLGGNTGYIGTSTTTITAPTGTVAGSAAAGVVDGASQQVNTNATAVTPSPLTTAQWDITRPTVSGCVLSDSYYNDSAFVADGTFHSGQDGKVDTLVCTSSETLTTRPDASVSRDDWTLTGVANEFGTSLTVIKATASGTTYTINFSGALTHYASSAFTILNTQDATPSFLDAGGNPVASGLTSETYKVCMTGFTCSGGTIASSGVLTASITQPSGGIDTTGPVAATALKAVVNTSMKVKLTWVDPSNAATIKIYKTLGTGVEVSLATVPAGLQTYTDESVSTGDVVKYRISAFDLSGNEGTKTDYTTITVAANATGTVTTTPPTTPVTDKTVDDVVTVDTTDDEETLNTIKTPVTLSDIDKSWAKTEIQTMVDKGIVKGNKDGTFKPEDALNKADAAVLICRVMKIDEMKAVDADPATDVKKDSYFGSCVSQLKSAKVVTGNPDGTYTPGKDANRAEFIALALRAYGTMLKDQAKTDFDASMTAATPKASFKDVDTKKDWYANVAATAKDKEFVKGRDGNFDGAKSITRAEATTVLFRIFKDLI